VITLIAIMAILDLGVYYVVIRPLRLVSKAADQASKGQMSTTPLVLRGKDEIADLTASFNRMQISLAKAFKLLG
jgi:HAMP domain-containing protein